MIFENRERARSTGSTNKSVTGSVKAGFRDRDGATKRSLYRLMSLSEVRGVQIVTMMEDYAVDESKQTQPISLPLVGVDLH